MSIAMGRIVFILVLSFLAASLFPPAAASCSLIQTCAEATASTGGSSGEWKYFGTGQHSGLGHVSGALQLSVPGWSFYDACYETSSCSTSVASHAFPIPVCATVTATTDATLGGIWTDSDTAGDCEDSAFELVHKIKDQKITVPQG